MVEKSNLEGPNETIGVRSGANNIELLNDSRKRSKSKEEGSPWKQKRHEYYTLTCLGVFGLREKTKGEDISALFSDFGRLSKLEIIGDNYTNQIMGFTFVYFEKSAVTKAVQTSLNNIEESDRKIMVDFPFKNPEWKKPQSLLEVTSSSNTNTSDTFLWQQQSH